MLSQQAIKQKPSIVLIALICMLFTTWRHAGTVYTIVVSWSAWQKSVFYWNS